jgi:hypothetical protein
MRRFAREEAASVKSRAQIAPSRSTILVFRLPGQASRDAAGSYLAHHHHHHHHAAYAWKEFWFAVWNTGASDVVQRKNQKIPSEFVVRYSKDAAKMEA